LPEKLPKRGGSLNSKVGEIMPKAKSTKKRATSKSKSSGKRVVGAGKSRATAKKVRGLVLSPRGAGSTAPVVYRTLRERTAAVAANVGSTEKLSDFLKGAGWA
jgi:hypothetical protein